MWRNRIVGYGDADPKDLEANLHNWRRHPSDQRSALEGALRELGWIQNVVVNKPTGRLIDGHLRVIAALDNGEPSVPVTFVELSEREEQLALATFDAISALATTDDAALRELLDLVSSEDDDLSDFLESLGGSRQQLGDYDGFDDPVVPDGGSTREPAEPALASRELVFKVDDQQRDKILAAVSGLGRDLEITPGEALYRICQFYLDHQDGLLDD